MCEDTGFIHRYALIWKYSVFRGWFVCWICISMVTRTSAQQVIHSCNFTNFDTCGWKDGPVRGLSASLHWRVVKLDLVDHSSKPTQDVTGDVKGAWVLWMDGTRNVWSSSAVFTSPMVKLPESAALVGYRFSVWLCSDQQYSSYLLRVRLMEESHPWRTLNTKSVETFGSWMRLQSEFTVTTDFELALTGESQVMYISLDNILLESTHTEERKVKPHMTRSLLVGTACLLGAVIILAFVYKCVRNSDRWSARCEELGYCARGRHDEFVARDSFRHQPNSVRQHPATQNNPPPSYDIVQETQPASPPQNIGSAQPPSYADVISGLYPEVS